MMTSRTTRTNSNSNSSRRNLFHQHLSRRPTASSTATSATTTIQTPAEEADEEIVVRDKDGSYQFEVPGIPTAGQDEVTEKEREDARLAEAVKYHLRDRNRRPSEPAELLAAVQHSLRETAASLKDDNWMYEAEDER